MSKIITDLGIYSTDVLEMFLSHDTFNPEQFIFLTDSVALNNTNAIFYKNPLKVKGTNVYTFAGKEGHYYTDNPNDEAFPNGYRYIWYVFFGFYPSKLGEEYTEGSQFPGGGNSSYYYPIGKDVLISGFQQAGYDVTTLSVTFSNIKNWSHILTGNSKYEYNQMTPQKYRISNDTWSNNTQNRPQYVYDWSDIIVKDKFGITDRMIGLTAESIEACLWCPKLPVSYDGNPIVCFQPAITGTTVNNLKDQYRVAEIKNGADGLRTFTYNHNVILNENLPNRCYYPFNVILYPQCKITTEASTTSVVENGACAIVFQGVEPI